MRPLRNAQIKIPTAIAGHHSNAIAVEAADPVDANALLFRQGSRRLLLISFDLLYIQRRTAP